MHARRIAVARAQVPARFAAVYVESVPVPSAYHQVGPIAVVDTVNTNPTVWYEAAVWRKTGAPAAVAAKSTAGDSDDGMWIAASWVSSNGTEVAIDLASGLFGDGVDSGDGITGTVAAVMTLVQAIMFTVFPCIFGTPGSRIFLRFVPLPH